MSDAALFLASLTAEQHKAATYMGGPLRIIAGAGTGKTRTLTARFISLVEEHHIPAHEILAVTFSSKAAAEMRSRIVEQLGGTHRRLWIQTFHAMCLRLLGEWARSTGDPDPRVLSTIERLHVVRRAIAQTPASGRRYYHGDHGARVLERDLVTYADRAWDDLIEPPLGETDRLTTARLGDLDRALRHYRNLLTRERVYDFGRLTAETITRLTSDAALREVTRSRFRHMLIDEFQDTNRAQFELVQLLVPAGKNVCVVGDENQAIYAFRGGRSEFFASYAQRFPGTKTFRLEQNYRSGQDILNAANNLVKHNFAADSDPGVQLALVAMRDQTSRITVTDSETAEIEAENVARRIVAIVHDPDRSIAWRDIAVLFRSVRTQIEPFRRAFALFGVPIALGAEVGLDYAIRQDVRAALNLILDGPTWNDAARLALGRGASALARKSIERRTPPTTLLALLDGYDDPQLSAEGIAFVETARTIVAEAAFAPRDSPALICYYAILLTRHLDERLDPGQARHLAQIIESANRLDAAADLINLMAAGATEQDDAPPNDEDGVQFLTVHAAKGLEWPVVFVVGLAEDVFPIAMRAEREGDLQALARGRIDRNVLTGEPYVQADESHIAEERRLAYVAVTRACRELHLSWARSYGDEPANPSRFLTELALPEGPALAHDDEFERLTSMYALGRQIRHRQSQALKVSVPDESAASALADLLVAQWAATTVPGVIPLRNRTIPAPYNSAAHIRFSASSLSTYHECPRQYLYQGLLRLAKEERGAHALLGTAVHTVLEHLNKGRLETGQIPSDDVADALVEEHWPPIGFDIPVQSEQFRFRARVMIRRYLDYERSLPPGRTPIWIEHRTAVPYHQHTVSGVVDLVMQNGDGSIDILDFKTGRHEAFTKSRQLFLYAWMWAQDPPIPAAGPISTAFIALKQEGDKGFVANERWEKKQLRASKVTPAWMDERHADVQFLVDGIVGNDFRPNPGSACASCHFRWICPDG